MQLELEQRRKQLEYERQRQIQESQQRRLQLQQVQEQEAQQKKLLLKKLQLQQQQQQQQTQDDEPQTYTYYSTPSVETPSDLKLSLESFMKQYEVEEDSLIGHFEDSMSQSEITENMLQNLFNYDQSNPASVSPEPFVI